MSSCQWEDRDGGECGRQAHGEGQFCLWHNPRVRKNDPYVIPLFEQELLLRGGSAVGFDLHGMIWPQAELPGVILREADLSDCVMPGADLSNADLGHADLSRAQLSGACLKGACLRNADLRGTHLGQADLRDADLRGATIDGTVLLGCDLRGANLTGAQLEQFVWNRFTRFTGVVGFEPPRGGASTDSANEITVPFPSALAANNDMELSHSLLQSLAPIDPALSRTRAYRNPARSRASGEGGEALVPRRLSASGEAAPQPKPSPRAAGRPFQRRWVALALLATIWATAASGLATWTMLMVEPESATQAAIDPADETTITDHQQYLRALQERETLLASMRKSIDDLNQQLRNSQSQLQLARAEAVGLRDAADENVTLREQLQFAEAHIRQLARQNRRLDETASILADGNERLREANQTLTTQNETRFAELEEVGRYRAERDRYRRELEEREAELASANIERNRLREELERSSANLERFLTRLEGTRLEGLLQADEERSPLMRVTAGQPLVMGGDDLLLTLRVEPAEQDGRVRVNAIVQRSDGQALPDISIVLYGDRGEALRRLSFSFPAPNPGMPFASALTEIDCPSFPSAVRISAAQGMDEHLISAQP